MEKNNNYNVSLENLKIGDILSFRIKSRLFKVRGEIRNIYYNEKNELFLNIYLFYNREEKTYRINNKNELLELSGSNNKKKKSNQPIIYSNLKEDKQFDNKHLSSIFKRVSYLIVLLIFIFSINPGIQLPQKLDNYPYSFFLKEEHSLNSLFQVVKSHIRYTYDIGDRWNMPLFAWNERNGDCEEFASICSDYLNRHNVENYLVGLTLKQNGQGHAVVFVYQKGNYYIIDPTLAAESSGLKKLKVSSLKDAVKLYSTLPATIYKVPSYEGEKKVLDYID